MYFFFKLEEPASGEGSEYEAVRVLNGNATYYQQLTGRNIAPENGKKGFPNIVNTKYVLIKNLIRFLTQAMIKWRGWVVFKTTILITRLTSF